MSNPIFFDIETKPLPGETLAKIMPEFKAPNNIKDEQKIIEAVEKKQADFVKNAALNPISSSVLAVGVFCEDGAQSLIHGENEPEVIEKTWSALTEHGAFTRDIIGWNIKRFDVPFLLKRSWACKIRPPSTVLELYRGRAYLNQRFVDLMEIWTMGGDPYCSLNSALHFFELDSKIDLGGKLFYELYDTDRNIALEYLQRDITALIDLNEIINIK